MSGSVRRAGPQAALLLLTSLAFSGCMTTAVEVPVSRFPVPLVEKIPLQVGLVLPPELTSFVYQEDLGERGEFLIDIGAAQEVMFTNLLSGMFTGVQQVESAAAQSSSIDGTLLPVIQEMQFSTPEQTSTDYFEVWIRYQFQLFSRDGVKLGEWPLTAYGKANTQNYGIVSTEETLREAALAACRDAMAFFTVQFRTVPSVRQWLAAELLRGEAR